jgi:hypothetical protein
MLARSSESQEQGGLAGARLAKSAILVRKDSEPGPPPAWMPAWRRGYDRAKGAAHDATDANLAHRCC